MAATGGQIEVTYNLHQLPDEKRIRITGRPSQVAHTLIPNDGGKGGPAGAMVPPYFLKIFFF
jgi:hypothetical protein